MGGHIDLAEEGGAGLQNADFGGFDTADCPKWLHFITIHKKTLFNLCVVLCNFSKIETKSSFSQEKVNIAAYVIQNCLFLNYFAILNCRRPSGISVVECRPLIYVGGRVADHCICSGDITTIISNKTTGWSWVRNYLKYCPFKYSHIEDYCWQLLRDFRWYILPNFVSAVWQVTCKKM